MYEELVKSLRNCAADDNGCCFLCPEDCNGPCQENLMTEAADAIEKLSDRNVGTWIYPSEKMTEKGKGGLFVRGRKLTNKDLLECITDPKPKTKADLIRSMTDEELAGIMVGDCPPNYPHGDCREYEKWDGNLDCQHCWLDWLRQKAEDGE